MSPLAKELKQVLDQHSQTTSSRSLRECHQFLSARLGESVPQLEELPQVPSKLQSKLSTELDNVNFADLLQRVNQKTKACLLSTSCKVSGAWLQAIPMTQHFSLSTEDFCLGVLMHLGLPIPDTRCLFTCPN